MNEEKIAKELSAVAGDLIRKSAGGPAVEVIKPFWNKIHDLENELQDVAQQYDVASSYSEIDGSDKAEKVRDMINDLVEQLEDVSMKAFDKVVSTEKDFVRKYGTPDEFAEEARNEIYPR